jgi:vancomycin resistance protein YoaR
MAVAADPDRRERRGAWYALAGVVILLGGLYAAGVFFLGGRIPAGTDIAGVDVGGLEGAEARARLDEAMTERVDRPIRLTDGARTIAVRPSSAGIGLDVDASVREAGGGRTWNPVEMVDVLFGAQKVDAVLEIDEDALDRQLDEVAGRVEQDPIQPSVTFRTTGSTQVVRPADGVSLDREATVTTLTDAFVEGERNGDLTLIADEPDVDSAELDTALRELAEPAVAGPIILDLGDRTAPLRVAQFAPALSLQVQDGELVPVFDVERLDSGLDVLSERIGSEPQDASVEVRGGRPVVVPDQPGLALVAEDVADALVPVLTETGDARRAEVGTAVARADFTTSDARALQITEQVSSFVTYFPYAEYRNINQSRAAELIDGTLLRPGETFSFNETVGERTEANGFVPGFIIADGVFREELGGGVSQVVTTTYNAAFFAGLEDVEHKPHSFYIDRYPVGREATVAWPTVDLKFRNNTPYGVLIEAWVVNSTPSRQGEMHVRMWSTDYWDIEAGVSEQYDFTSPSTRYDDTDACVATTGYGGFTVEVRRFVRRAGSPELLRTEEDEVVYTPADTVICTG